jgi:hypothetical protein
MPATLFSIHEKISRCNADEWDEIVRVSRSGILMSHGFVAAVEEAFEDQARFAPSRSTSTCLLTDSRDGSPRS